MMLRFLQLNAKELMLKFCHRKKWLRYMEKIQVMDKKG